MWIVRARAAVPRSVDGIRTRKYEGDLRWFISNGMTAGRPYTHHEDTQTTYPQNIIDSNRSLRDYYSIGNCNIE